jgi:hypothetical protein
LNNTIQWFLNFSWLRNDPDPGVLIILSTSTINIWYLYLAQSWGYWNGYL